MNIPVTPPTEARHIGREGCRRAVAQVPRAGGDDLRRKPVLKVPKAGGDDPSRKPVPKVLKAGGDDPSRKPVLKVPKADGDDPSRKPVLKVPKADGDDPPRKPVLKVLKADGDDPPRKPTLKEPETAESGEGNRGGGTGLLRDGRALPKPRGEALNRGNLKSLWHFRNEPRKPQSFGKLSARKMHDFAVCGISRSGKQNGER